MNVSDYQNLIVEESGARLDKYISLMFPDISRTRAQKLIDDGHITVDAKPAKASLKLEKGQHISITIPQAEPTDLKPENIPLTILYEDADLLIVDKPAGMTVHPAPGHHSGTLVNALLAHLPGLQAGESFRPGIVHRLDKDTSGLLIIAKTPVSHMKLASQFKNRTITKVYQTLVRGRVKNESGIIEAAIGRDPKARQRMAIVSEGRPAVTEYRILHLFKNFTLLEVHPRTGRTHQIRVHLSAIGHPVVGDAIYGNKSELLNRQFLHACKVGFNLPSSGQYREFFSELPSDLKQALTLLEETA